MRKGVGREREKRRRQADVCGGVTRHRRPGHMCLEREKAALDVPDIGPDGGHVTLRIQRLFLLNVSGPDPGTHVSVRVPGRRSAHVRVHVCVQKNTWSSLVVVSS